MIDLKLSEIATSINGVFCGEDKIIKGVVGSPGITIPTAPSEKLKEPTTMNRIFLNLNFDFSISYNCTNYRS